MTTLPTPSNFNDGYDNMLIQKDDIYLHRPLPDDDEDPNEPDIPVEPDKGDDIPQPDNDIENDNDDVLNESIVEPDLIPSEDVDTGNTKNGSP